MNILCLPSLSKFLLPQFFRTVFYLICNVESLEEIKVTQEVSK
jgi:hypothetical protein